MTAEPVLESLRQLWLVLRQNKVEAAVVGGLALNGTYFVDLSN